MSETLEVWIDAASVGELTRVGRIAHNRGHVRFQYDRAWLPHPRCFDIDPDLTLDQATFHPDPAIGHFGIFLDSSPDRWGQTLMKRREALEAKAVAAASGEEARKWRWPQFFASCPNKYRCGIATIRILVYRRAHKISDKTFSRSSSMGLVDAACRISKTAATCQLKLDHGISRWTLRPGIDRRCHGRVIERHI